MQRCAHRIKAPARLLPALLAAALALGSGNAAAIGLLAAYDAAMKNGPAYRAAFF